MNIYYMKFRFKLVKFINLEMLSPNFAAPSAPILFSLINQNYNINISIN